MSRPVAEVGSTASSYEILAKLAAGGMAEIFLARGASAAGVERYVVLKRVLAHHANNPDFVQMFLDEARLAAQLQHPNIAQVFDVGKLGDSYFFTMEYVHGETVRALLQRSHGLRRLLPVQSVLTIAAGAAAGLHHAHTRNGLDGRPLGIVHRDISPSNLMVSYEGAVKVVDFGVAKAAHRSHETRSGAVKGKISYLSPEQCRGFEVDRRSDIFSLGIVIWEMLTTQRLYKHDSDFENMSAIVNTPTPAPSTLRPDVPRELDAIVLRCLAKSPAERYQTADELHEAIEEAAVRIGCALSASSLGRQMRDLFGQRPEPWIELQVQHAHPEIVTVTRDPLLPPGPNLAMTIMGHQPPRAHTPSLTPSGSGGMLPLQMTPSHGAVLPRAPSYTQDPSFAPPSRGIPRAVLILGPAVLIGVAIGIVFALRGNKSPSPSPTVALAPASPSPSPIPPPSPTPPPTPTPTPSPPPAAAPDAAVAEPPQPTAPPVENTQPPQPPVEKTHKTSPPHPPSPSSPPTFDELLRAGKYSDIVHACTDADTLDKNTVSCVAAACRAHETTKARKWYGYVVSASKKSSLVATCAKEHIALEAPKQPPPPSQTDECKRDPMACPH